MKRFLLFAGCAFQAIGGMNDFIGSFDTLEEALKAMENFYKEKSKRRNETIEEAIKSSFGHIWDVHQMKEVWSKD